MRLAHCSLEYRATQRAPSADERSLLQPPMIIARSAPPFPSLPDVSEMGIECLRTHAGRASFQVALAFIDTHLLFCGFSSDSSLILPLPQQLCSFLLPSMQSTSSSVPCLSPSRDEGEKGWRKLVVEGSLCSVLLFLCVSYVCKPRVCRCPRRPEKGFECPRTGIGAG